MGRHRTDIGGHHDEALLLGPAKEFRIAGPDREIGLITDASDLERLGTPRVGSAKGRPDRAAQILIDDVA